MLLKIFFVGFFINLLYELLHSVLYKTCIEAKIKKYIYLILKAALFDGFAISTIYFTSILISQKYKILLFLILSLIFAYIWEIYSLKKGKWEYMPAMPKVLGVGITPVVQLSFTGLISIYISLNFLI